MSIIEKYNSMLSEGRTNARKVGWGSEKSQQKRFEILCEVANISNATVLDVGCGLGDFYDYLVSKSIKVEYTGIDINQNMIEKARQGRSANKFLCADMKSDYFEENSFDYVFLSGAFNLSEDNHLANVEKTVSKMFAAARSAVAFNIMSLHAPYFGPGEYYACPEKLLGMMLRLSKKVVLRHDYMDHDFTIYLYK